MLLMLAWAAGIIDAVSYLALDRVFTAMMTGNTVLLALAIGQGKAAAVLRSVLALVGFSAGAAMGALIVARGESRGEWPPAVTAALAPGRHSARRLHVRVRWEPWWAALCTRDHRRWRPG